MSFLDSDFPRLESTWMGARRELPSEARHQVAWVDEASGEVRGFVLVQPEAGPEAFWEALVQAVVEPRQGLPGLPARLLVEETSLQETLQELLQGTGIPVEVSPRLLAGEALEKSARRLARAAGYLSREDAEPASVAAFFDSAARWAALEPWMALEDSDLLLLDGLADSPLVASVMGANSPDQGLALFASVDQLAAFLEDSRQVRLFMQFAPPEVAGPVVQAEIARHGWPLADPDWIPVASNPGDPRPFAGPADLRLLSRVMEAIEVYLESDLPGQEPVVDEMLALADGCSFRVTRQRWSTEAAPPTRRPGRNEPCWCGSGRKYKKCHLDHDQQASRPSDAIGPGSKDSSGG